MRMSIERVVNGWIVSTDETEVNESGDVSTTTFVEVVEEEDDNTASAAVNLLWKVVEYFALRGNKYDKERVSIGVEKQDQVP